MDDERINEFDRDDYKADESWLDRLFENSSRR